MNFLDLLSGAGSLNNVGRAVGFEVVSLDMDMGADIMDVRNWNYQEACPPKFLDVIWAPTHGTHASTAEALGVRNIEGSHRIVPWTIDIMDNLEPIY